MMKQKQTLKYSRTDDIGEKKKQLDFRCNGNKMQFRELNEQDSVESYLRRYKRTTKRIENTQFYPTFYIN